VVLDEGQHAVAAGVEGLEGVEAVAVGLHDVDVVLGRVSDGELPEHEPVGAVDVDADVLLVARGRRAAVAGRRIAGLDDDVVGADARALDLQVAADARAEVGDPVAVLERRVGVLAGPLAAPDHGDQVRVVGAVDLVGVRQRTGVAGVRVRLVLVAGRVVGGLRARRRARCRARA